MANCERRVLSFVHLPRLGIVPGDQQRLKRGEERSRKEGNWIRKILSTQKRFLIYTFNTIVLLKALILFRECFN